MPYYHVEIWQKDPKARVEVSLDLTREELESRFLVPYRTGLSITLNGKTVPIDSLDRIKISMSEENAEQLRETLERRRTRTDYPNHSPVGDYSIAREGRDVTDEYITGPPGSMSTPDIQDPTTHPPEDAREIFVVHGRNSAARDALFAFLRTIDLHPLEWSEATQGTGQASPYIGEILNAAFSRAHAVVVLLTPDDEAQLRKPFRQDFDPPHETQLTGQARPNVLFEAGMAMGRNEERTIILEMGELRPFSDVAGRHTIRFVDNSQSRQELAKRLANAGCPVNLNGTDWHTAGDFNAALGEMGRNPSQPTGTTEEQSTTAEHPQLTEEAKCLLVKVTKGQSRRIQKIRMKKGVQFKAGGANLNAVGDSRSEAKWEQALEDLKEQGLVRGPNGQGITYEVTDKGFDFADELIRQEQFEN